MIYHVVSGALALCIFCAVICRVRHMHPSVTKISAFIPHLALAVGAFAAVVLPIQYAIPSILGAVLLSLLMGAKRWAHEAPEDTKKPDQIAPLWWPQIVGGGDKE
jgi:hypothetical protein